MNVRKIKIFSSTYHFMSYFLFDKPIILSYCTCQIFWYFKQRACFECPSGQLDIEKVFLLAFFGIGIRLCVLFTGVIRICGLWLIDIFTLSDHERIPFISNLIFYEKDKIYRANVGGIIMYVLKYLLCFRFLKHWWLSR